MRQTVLEDWIWGLSDVPERCTAGWVGAWTYNLSALCSSVESQSNFNLQVSLVLSDFEAVDTHRKKKPHINKANRFYYSGNKFIIVRIYLTDNTAFEKLEAVTISLL